MKFSLNFIQDFIKVKVSAQKLSELLTMAGMEVESLKKSENDWIFDIEVTTNRYDWLSLVGIAKEVATVLGQKLDIKYPAKSKDIILNNQRIVINEYSSCPYYIGCGIKGVKIKKSESWLKERITNCGINSINNIVDITNYCMLKWGNPLHAFDWDKIEGDIYVRKADKGEDFLGIDSKKRELDRSNLVIADSKKIIAIAGVIGAKNTEVDENTKNIFLESAIFSPLVVRRSRRSVGINTESSYRFERMVSPLHLEHACQEAISLIKKMAYGVVSGKKRVGKKSTTNRKKIVISLNDLNIYLGANFSKKEVKNILKNLRFSIREVSSDKLEVQPEVERLDIVREVDIYEELCRIYGYDKIPSQIPFLTHNLANAEKGMYSFKLKISDFSALCGFREIMTYSLEKEEDSLLFNNEKLVKIINPLRTQEGSLRNCLLSGMIKCMRHNLNYSQNCLRLFEIADVYYQKGKGFVEMPVLILGIAGKEEDFFYLKQVVENICNFLRVKKFRYELNNSPKGFESALDVKIDGVNGGFLGKINEEAKQYFNVKENLFFAQLYLPILFKAKQKEKYLPFSVYPEVSRDISICLSKNIRFAEVEKVVKEENNNFSRLQIVSFYKGKEVPQDAKIFTLRIFYQSLQKTLTSQEVDVWHNNIREKLACKNGIELR